MLRYVIIFIIILAYIILSSRIQLILGQKSQNILVENNFDVTLLISEKIYGKWRVRSVNAEQSMRELSGR